MRGISGWRAVVRVVAVLLVSGCGAWCGAGAQQIALTFDDLPAHSSLPPGETRQQVVTQILAALKQAGVPPVIGFVNAVRIQEQPDTVHVLEAWRAAGYPLGSHTWSHMNLNDHTLAEFEADVLKDEPVLEQQMGAGDWHWLRFPYLAEGKDAAQREGVRTFLAEHHYKVAGVTMSFGDYAWNEPYARCSAKGDSAAIQELEASYLKAAGESVDFSRAMAKALYGHDIPYVLLMHLGAFDARMLPRLLALYRSLGVTFVTMQQAETDPFYKPDVDLTAAGPDTLEGAMYARHLPFPEHAGMPKMLETVCR